MILTGHLGLELIELSSINKNSSELLELGSINKLSLV